MNYEWADGFHAPKGVSADDVKEALDKLPEPSPDALLEATKRKSHVLHGEIWGEGDQIWANRGRLERCRKIVASVCEVITVGKNDIQVRSVEFVKHNGGHWSSLDAIRKDPDLLEAYAAEVQRLQDQASAKMSKLRQLMKAR